VFTNKKKKDIKVKRLEKQKVSNKGGKTFLIYWSSSKHNFQKEWQNFKNH